MMTQTEIYSSISFYLKIILFVEIGLWRLLVSILMSLLINPFTTSTSRIINLVQTAKVSATLDILIHV